MKLNGSWYFTAGFKKKKKKRVMLLIFTQGKYAKILAGVAAKVRV